MKRSLVTTLILVLALAAVVVGVVPFADAQSLDRVDQVSRSSFDKTVQQVKAAIQSKGQMIVATIDHQNMLRMLGVNSKGAVSIEFGKPDMLKTFLVPNPEIGLDIPLRIYIWQRQDGQTVMSYYRVGPVFARYGKRDLKMAGEMMDKLLAEIVAAGTR